MHYIYTYVMYSYIVHNVQYALYTLFAHLCTRCISGIHPTLIYVSKLKLSEGHSPILYYVTRDQVNSRT